MGPVALYWAASGGCAQCDGVTVKLRQLPHIEGLPSGITELSYFHRRGELRIACDRMQEMTGEQGAAVAEWLHCMASAARIAVESK